MKCCEYGPWRPFFIYLSNNFYEVWGKCDAENESGSTYILTICILIIWGLTQSLIKTMKSERLPPKERQTEIQTGRRTNEQARHINILTDRLTDGQAVKRQGDRQTDSQTTQER